MPDEAVQMQQIGEALVAQPDHPQPQYLGRVLGTAWALLSLATLRTPHGQREDGLEAFDMLGGWKGSDFSRRDIK
ncbi:hypothetical protein [Aminobacter sp. HY435]|uniref:hypothetical protein n=1 Tax=Aminobacter sp. HY435 TaxID=2970917 RepID=UPI0022B99D47|nr:hypothetical protein [Aminobacter sp. HY435]